MDASRIAGGRVFRSRERTSYAPYQRDRRSFRQQNYLCKNCKRPGHFARECPNDAVCNNCGQAGHMAADCNSKTMCWNCKEPGHLSTECNNQPICHSCGKMGHLARECPKSSDPRVCSNCFQPGHVAADCINEKACNKCRKPGHFARDCLNDPICNICNVPGHVARQCPNTALQPPIMAGPPPFPPPWLGAHIPASSAGTAVVQAILVRSACTRSYAALVVDAATELLSAPLDLFSILSIAGFDSAGEKGHSIQHFPSFFLAFLFF